MENDPAKRTDNVYKAMQSLDRFINTYPEDGGCDEGPAYWNHAGSKLFESLELLHAATNGSIDLFQNELIKNMGRYIYKAHISDSYFVNFADASARVEISPGVVYRYGKAIRDSFLQGFGAYHATRNRYAEIAPIGRIEAVVRGLMDANEIAMAKGIAPLLGECWLPDLQFAAGRDMEGSKQGFYFAAKGGHNGENHNHNDVGNFVLYYNGLPALIDVGVGRYVKETFSHKRYTIWTMQSGYHNLPVINGIDQQEGKKFAARNAKFDSSAKTVSFSLDLAGAYPDSAAVEQWVRGYTLNRQRSFVIDDRYKLSEAKGANALYFMTACKARIEKPGYIKLEGDGFGLGLCYNPKVQEAHLEQLSVTDSRLQSSWGNTLTRVVLKFSSSGLTGKSEITIVPTRVDSQPTSMNPLDSVSEGNVLYDWGASQNLDDWKVEGMGNIRISDEGALWIHTENGITPDGKKSRQSNVWLKDLELPDNYEIAWSYKCEKVGNLMVIFNAQPFQLEELFDDPRSDASYDDLAAYKKVVCYTIGFNRPGGHSVFRKLGGDVPETWNAPAYNTPNWLVRDSLTILSNRNEPAIPAPKGANEVDYKLRYEDGRVRFWIDGALVHDETDNGQYPYHTRALRGGKIAFRNFSGISHDYYTSIVIRSL